MPTLLLPYTNISFWNCSFKMANLQTRAKARVHFLTNFANRRYLLCNTFSLTSLKRNRSGLFFAERPAQEEPAFKACRPCHICFSD